MPEIDPRAAHENAGIATRSVLIVGAILFAAVAVIAAVLYVLLQHRILPQRAQEAARPAMIPPPPRLQSHAPQDLAVFRAQKESLLESYAWLDAQHTTARIPVERAMALYAQRPGASNPTPDPAAMAGLTQPGAARSALRAPPQLEQRVGIDQNLGAEVPLNMTFTDAGGRSLTLAALLDGKPALLVPSYYRCENLCDAVRAGIAQAVAASGLVPGPDFQVLVVSFDARDSPEDARRAWQLDTIEHRGAGLSRWQYLTGAEASALMRIVGFRYRFDARDGQFAHAAGAVILSPAGNVMQYLLGVQYDPHSLRLALVNGAHGRIGSLLDQLILLCCRYDASTGRYSVTIDRILSGLAIGTALLLAALVALLLRRERLRRRAAAGALEP